MTTTEQTTEFQPKRGEWVRYEGSLHEHHGLCQVVDRRPEGWVLQSGLHLITKVATEHISPDIY
jgi:hypothetical protein